MTKDELREEAIRASNKAWSNREWNDDVGVSLYLDGYRLALAHARAERSPVAISQYMPDIGEVLFAAVKLQDIDALDAIAAELVGKAGK